MTEFQPNSVEQELLLDLCSSIQEWQQSYVNNYSEDTLKIDWSAVSKLMKERKHKVSDVECCRKWKYLAYGKVIKKQNPLEVQSDDEDAFYQPLSAYKRFKEIPSDSSNNDSEVCALVQRQHGDLASSSKIRALSRKIKVPSSILDLFVIESYLLQFLVPEQIPSGVAHLHVPVFSGDYAFQPVQ